MTLRHLPNTISIMRILLVAPIVWSMVIGDYDVALWLIIVAGVSDAADGYCARRFGWQTYAGALLDPAADKLLLVASFLALGTLAFAPWWLIGTVFARDVIIVAMYLHRREPVSERPTTISKINTFAQTACVLLLVYGAAHGANAVLIDTWLAITLMTTVFSGVRYLWLWGAREARLRRARA